MISNSSLMRRLAAILLNFLTLLSLLLCVAVVVLWVRGYYVVDVPAVITGRSDSSVSVRDEWRAMSGKGVVAVVWQRDVAPPGPLVGRGGPRFSYTSIAPSRFAVARDTWWQRLGFHYATSVHRDPALPAWTRHNRSLRVPHWLAVAALGVGPARRLPRLWLERRRRPAGVCPSCGYDLRATPGRCPECGTIAASHPAA